MTAPYCGGCAGLGSHRRWCPEIVGPYAALVGAWADEVEGIADACGIPSAANNLWRAASILREAAHEHADAYRQGESPA